MESYKFMIDREGNVSAHGWGIMRRASVFRRCVADVIKRVEIKQFFVVIIEHASGFRRRRVTGASPDSGDLLQASHSIVLYSEGMSQTPYNVLLEIDHVWQTASYGLGIGSSQVVRRTSGFRSHVTCFERHTSVSRRCATEVIRRAWGSDKVSQMSWDMRPDPYDVSQTLCN